MGYAVQDRRASVSDLAHSPCRLLRRLRHPSLDSVPFLPLSQSYISLSFQPSPLSLGVIAGDIWCRIWGGASELPQPFRKNVVSVTKQQLQGARAQKPHRAYPRAIFGISCTDLFRKETASGSG